MPSNLAAVPPRIAILSSSVRPGIDRMWSTGTLVPRERVVGAEHDLADAALGDQVAHRLGGEHDRVEIELAVLQVLGRLFLRQRADPVREGRDHRVRAAA